MDARTFAGVDQVDEQVVVFVPGHARDVERQVVSGFKDPVLAGGEAPNHFASRNPDRNDAALALDLQAVVARLKAVDSEELAVKCKVAKVVFRKRVAALIKQRIVGARERSSAEVRHVNRLALDGVQDDGAAVRVFSRSDVPGGVDRPWAGGSDPRDVWQLAKIDPAAVVRLERDAVAALEVAVLNRDTHHTIRQTLAGLPEDLKDGVAVHPAEMEVEGRF